MDGDQPANETCPHPLHEALARKLALRMASGKPPTNQDLVIPPRGAAGGIPMAFRGLSDPC
jgi:hypothetical protein